MLGKIRGEQDRGMVRIQIFRDCNRLSSPVQSPSQGASLILPAPRSSSDPELSEVGFRRLTRGATGMYHVKDSLQVANTGRSCSQKTANPNRLRDHAGRMSTAYLAWAMPS